MVRIPGSPVYGSPPSLPPSGASVEAEESKSMKVARAAGRFSWSIGSFIGKVGWEAVKLGGRAASSVAETVIKNNFKEKKDSLVRSFAQSFSPDEIMQWEVLDKHGEIKMKDGKPIMRKLSFPAFLQAAIFDNVPKFLLPVLWACGFGERWRNRLVLNAQDNLSYVLNDENTMRLGGRILDVMPKAFAAYADCSPEVHDREFLDRLGIMTSGISDDAAVKQWKQEVNDRCSEKIGRLLVRAPDFHDDEKFTFPESRLNDSYKWKVKILRKVFGARFVNFLRKVWHRVTLKFRQTLVREITNICWPLLSEIWKIMCEKTGKGKTAKDLLPDIAKIALGALGIRTQTERLLDSLAGRGDVLFYYLLEEILDEAERILERQDIGEEPSAAELREKYLLSHVEMTRLVTKIEEGITQEENKPENKTMGVFVDTGTVRAGTNATFLKFLEKQGDSSSMYDIAAPALSKLRNLWRDWCVDDKPENI
jgi:hypothetical protein